MFVSLSVGFPVLVAQCFRGFSGVFVLFILFYFLVLFMWGCGGASIFVVLHLLSLHRLWPNCLALPGVSFLSGA